MENKKEWQKPEVICLSINADTKNNYGWYNDGDGSTYSGTSS